MDSSFEVNKIAKEIPVAEVVEFLSSAPWPVDLATIASHLRVRKQFLLDSIRDGSLNIVSLPVPHAPTASGLLYTDTEGKKESMESLYLEIFDEARELLELEFNNFETRKALLDHLDSLDLPEWKAKVSKYEEIFSHKNYSLKPKSVFERLLKEDKYKYWLQ